MKSKEQLRQVFKNGYKPDQEDFWDWQDSYWHKEAPEDIIPANRVDLSAKADLVNGKVPAEQLPSYVDDVIEFESLYVFPTTGETGKLFLAKNTGKIYRWSGSQYIEIVSANSGFANTGSANIATADLTNTSPRTFTQNASFTWDTLGNPYYVKGLPNIGTDYTNYSRVLRINSATKQIVEGDALVVSIPDTLLHNALPSSQNLNIVHTYTNTPTQLNTNVQELNNFIMNIGNQQFTNLSSTDWFVGAVNGNTSANVTKNDIVYLRSTVTNMPTGTVTAYAYPNLILPANKNWCFVIGCNIPHGAYENHGLIGITSANNTNDIGLLQGFISSLGNSSNSGTANLFNYTGYGGEIPADRYISKGNSLIIFTKVGNILNITVRANNEVKTENIDVTGIPSFKPLLNLLIGYVGNTSASITSDFGRYYIQP